MIRFIFSVFLGVNYEIQYLTGKIRCHTKTLRQLNITRGKGGCLVASNVKISCIGRFYGAN